MRAQPGIVEGLVLYIKSMVQKKKTNDRVKLGRFLSSLLLEGDLVADKMGGLKIISWKEVQNRNINPPHISFEEYTFLVEKD